MRVKRMYSLVTAVTREHLVELIEGLQSTGVSVIRQHVPFWKRCREMTAVISEYFMFMQ